jgi:hypothetical protein
VIASAPDRPAGATPALTAVRARAGLVALLFALAAIGWWSTADRMRAWTTGRGPRSGTLGWFLGVWVVMMAAMMFPSLRRRSRCTRAWRGIGSRRCCSPPGYLVAWGSRRRGARSPIARAGRRDRR